MKKLRLCLFCLSLAGLLTARSEAAAKAHQAPPAQGQVSIQSPAGSSSSSLVHYVATATTACPGGVSSIGVYSAPHQLAYLTKGANLDATITLAPGNYDTVVQEWDNCHGVAKTHVAVSVGPGQPSGAWQILTANNTSAAPTFTAQSNGNAGAGSVSKVDIHTLLYTGTTTQIYAELQPWFGDKRHMQVGYTSWDPVEVENQLEDMQSRGITGVVIDWYGPADDTEATTLAWLAAAENHSNFKVIIMIDKGAVTLSPCPSCSPQQTMIYLTNYVLSNFASSPAYATSQGKPIITQFDLDLHYSLNWPAIQAATSANVVWIFENANGFTHPVTGGSWAWMNATSRQYGMNYLTNFYNQAQQYPQEMAWGAGYKGFNDTLASWSLNRVQGQQCGQTWLETFDKINTYYNSNNQLPVLQLVTWNDYEEGTETETGIDNCLSVSSQLSGSVLAWTVNGNENTVDHYAIYYSPDGQNLVELNTLPVGTSSMDLSPFNLSSGTVYVQAVGKPMIRNQVSSGVTLAAQ